MGTTPGRLRRSPRRRGRARPPVRGAPRRHLAVPEETAEGARTTRGPAGRGGRRGRRAQRRRGRPGAARRRAGRGCVGPAEHRRGRDGRRLDGPGAGDEEPGDALEAGRHLRPLLRRQQPVLPLACCHADRSAAPPRRCADQHLRGAVRRPGRLRRVRGQRRSAALLQRAPAARRLPDRLRGQVPQRVRAGQPDRHAGRATHAPAGRAGLGRLRGHLRRRLQRLALLPHEPAHPAGRGPRSGLLPATRPRGQREGQGPLLRRQRHRAARGCAGHPLRAVRSALPAPRRAVRRPRPHRPRLGGRRRPRLPGGLPRPPGPGPPRGRVRPT